MKRPLLFAAFLAVAAIIAVVLINRDKTNPDVANRDPQPTDPGSLIGNQKSAIDNSSWHGWPADAPPPAIAPFNAEQARQHQEAWAKYLNIDVEYTNSIGMKFRLIPPGEFTMGSTAEEIEEALKLVGEEKYWGGNKDEDLVRVGWFAGNSGIRTHAAGELKANPDGLRDIHGNVWEWVQDGWAPAYYCEFAEKPANAPSNSDSAGSQRVIRGGSWYHAASYWRAAARNAVGPTGRGHDVGFRVSLVAGVCRVAHP